MIVLADNDVILKIARCNLFCEFLEAFAVTVADIRILPTARFSITSDKHRKRLGMESFTRLKAFLDRVADIETDPEPTTVAALTEQFNIDAGEAVLFAVGQLLSDSFIVTGDKKSLSGLFAAAGNEPVCESLCEVLAGRVYCFEQVLFRILDHCGFPAVRQKLIDGRECDRGLALWLGSGLNANEADVREGLISFIREARQESGNLLSTTDVV